MDPQGRRKLITAFALISGILVVVAFCAQQYITYRSESQTLAASMQWIDHALKRARAVERKPGRLDQAINGVAEKLSQQRLQVPATLDVEGFLNRFTAMANRFDVEATTIQSKSSSLDFYDRAILRLKLVGDDRAIRTVLEELSTGDRLAQHKMLQCADNECDVALSIFSIPDPEEESVSVLDIQACAEFNSKLWLWPLRGRIEDKKQELRTLCEARQRQSSALRSTRELKEKLRLSQFIGEVIKHLETAESPRQAE